MSRSVKLIAATVLYGAMMYGVYVVAMWGYDRIGLWTLALMLPVALAGGLWFDRQDRLSPHR